jgi:hypothetical protein
MNELVIKNARLSFPSLFKPSAFDAGAQPKYSATLILDKKEDAAAIATLRQLVSALATEQWSKLPKKVFYSLQDGDTLDRAEYEGKYIVKANNKKRVPIIDKDLTALVEEDERPYAGCYVNCKVRFYAWSNGTSFNGVLCSLEAVQFAKDGDSFGGGGNALDGFDAIHSETAEDVAEEAEEFLA